GESVELKLEIFPGPTGAHAETYLVPCRIANTARLDKGMRIGLSRLDFSEPENGSPRFPAGHLVDDFLTLTAKIRNPFLYNEWAEAKLLAIGPNASFVFESSDPALLLFAGARITVDVEVPLDSKGILTGKVKWIRPGGEGKLVFSIGDNDLSFDLSNAIGEHFIQSEICKPSLLSDFGIRVKRFKDQFRFRFITTQEEYEGLLGLRRAAYVQAGKLAPDASIDPAEAEFDARSRLLTAFHGETLVASIALCFGTPNVPFRSEGSFPGSKYPDCIPPRHTLIEARSLCTDFDYRGGDLIQGMFEHIARCILFSDRRWMITFTTDRLWPLYRRIGFRKTGVSVAVKDLGGLKHHLILLHRDSLVCGLRMTPFDWNYFFGQLVRELVGRGQLRLGKAQKARLAWYSLFSGMTRKWIRAQLERDFRILLQKNPARTEDDR
ncbi:MAG TPA: hypothetical protein VJ385_04955, partial [Fibrobacteria bacterium]|nr:hypothetical protein [Fibrobacteria bacterium]